jgi:hypothetical protein
MFLCVRAFLPVLLARWISWYRELISQSSLNAFLMIIHSVPSRN